MSSTCSTWFDLVSKALSSRRPTVHLLHYRAVHPFLCDLGHLVVRSKDHPDVALLSKLPLRRAILDLKTNFLTKTSKFPARVRTLLVYFGGGMFIFVMMTTTISQQNTIRYTVSYRTIINCSGVQVPAFTFPTVRSRWAAELEEMKCTTSYENRTSQNVKCPNDSV